jgi:hypothetical protein
MSWFLPPPCIRLERSDALLPGTSTLALNVSLKGSNRPRWVDFRRWGGSLIGRLWTSQHSVDTV